MLDTFTHRREFHLPSLEHTQTGRATDALDAQTLETPAVARCIAVVVAFLVIIPPERSRMGDLLLLSLSLSLLLSPLLLLLLFTISGGLKPHEKTAPKRASALPKAHKLKGEPESHCTPPGPSLNSPHHPQTSKGALN